MFHSYIILIGLIILVCASSSSEMACLIVFNNTKQLNNIAYKNFDKTKFLMTMLIVSITCTVGIQNILSTQILNDYSFSYKIIITTSCCLFLCEILPKSIGILFAHPVMLLGWKLFKHIVKSGSFILNMISIPSKSIVYLISKLVPIHDNLTYIELSETLKVCKKHKIISLYESHHILQQYKLLTMMSCEDIHTPIQKIIYIDRSNFSWSALNIEDILQQEYVPLCYKTIQEIESVISVYDLLCLKRTQSSVSQIYKHATKPIFIHEHTPIPKLVMLMTDNDIPSFSIDEYGAIKGMISKQTLLLSMISENLFSTDNKKIEWLSSSSLILPGDVTLSALFQATGIELVSLANMKTIGGWICEHLGSIPKPGEKISTELLSIRIIDASNTRVLTVYLKLLE